MTTATSTAAKVAKGVSPDGQAQNGFGALIPGVGGSGGVDFTPAS